MYVNKLLFFKNNKIKIIIIMLLKWKDLLIEFPDIQKFTQCIVNAQARIFIYSGKINE